MTKNFGSVNICLVYVLWSCRRGSQNLKKKESVPTTKQALVSCCVCRERVVTSGEWGGKTVENCPSSTSYHMTTAMTKVCMYSVEKTEVGSSLSFLGRGRFEWFSQWLVAWLHECIHACSL